MQEHHPLWVLGFPQVEQVAWEPHASSLKSAEPPTKLALQRTGSLIASVQELLFSPLSPLSPSALRLYFY
ncbi:hypothetical protein [Dendronalium sp. ChiSLP03b]|uniref:hypothetical protein n=1 Tax=Dendronalium sp. ChiSLP03b TaxID=3075381 RepID=UPI002ADD225F|nr:hypothetical protein [Dendronalium sp. ChiSLP03b]